MLCEFFAELLESFVSCCMLACNFCCRITCELALSSFHALTRLSWSGFGQPLVQSLCILHIPQPQPDTEDGVNLGNQFSTSIVSSPSLLSSFWGNFFGDISIIFTKDCLFSLVPTKKNTNHIQQDIQCSIHKETMIGRLKLASSPGHFHTPPAFDHLQYA